jgi:hypothetical protein
LIQQLKKRFSSLRIVKVSRSAVAQTGFCGLPPTESLLALQKKKVINHPRSASIIYPALFVNPVKQSGVDSDLD